MKVENLFYFIYLAQMKTYPEAAKVNETLTLFVEGFFYLCAAEFAFFILMVNSRYPGTNR